MIITLNIFVFLDKSVLFYAACIFNVQYLFMLYSRSCNYCSIAASFIQEKSRRSLLVGSSPEHMFYLRTGLGSSPVSPRIR